MSEQNPERSSLQVPSLVDESVIAREVLRVWRTDEGQTLSLNWREWEDPGAWGLLLVDVARHVARAYSEGRGDSPDDTLRRIRELFDAEWENPTDTPTGGMP